MGGKNYLQRWSGSALQAKVVMSAVRLVQSLHWNLENCGQEGSLLPGMDSSMRGAPCWLTLESLWLWLGEGSTVAQPGRWRPAAREIQVGRTGARRFTGD